MCKKIQLVVTFNHFVVKLICFTAVTHIVFKFVEFTENNFCGAGALFK